MKFFMREQEKRDLLIEVISWAGLTVLNIIIIILFGSKNEDVTVLWAYKLMDSNESVLLKSTVIIRYAPLNNWQNLFRGHVQMNFHIWILIKELNVSMC